LVANQLGKDRMKMLLIVGSLLAAAAAAHAEDPIPLPSPATEASKETPAGPPPELVSNPNPAASATPTPTPDAGIQATNPKTQAEKVYPEFAPPPSYMPQQVQLTDEEKVGVEITRQWRANSLQSMSQAPGPDGSVQFVFGSSMPSIVSAVLQVTDLELEPGEIVNGVHVGDSVRWTVETAVSGEGATQTAHLLIKPSDVDLETSLVIMTNKRTYHFVIRSHQTEYMHLVSLTYPNEKPTQPVVVKASPSPTPNDDVQPVKLARRDPKRVVDSQSDEADDKYQISGSAAWKPVNVYNNGTKTYIEMPKGIGHMEAPSLYVIRKSGLFHSEKVMVNYRVHGKWYVVDSVVDKAILIAGVGGNQDKVTIAHQGVIK
jgi:P-type conjugative transfer protein TrbG